jgi:methylated-DNA-[protein]-cysteine S-methyltransferase
MSREAWRRDQPRFRQEIAQLLAYFAGELREFEMTLNPTGSEFQIQVWCALTELEYGVTTTYGGMAERLGRPGAARAVGAANGRNPIWFIVPCHRLVGANGSLTGYGGGLAVKRALLALESGQSFARALQEARASMGRQSEPADSA